MTPSANGSTPASRAATLSGPRPAAPTEEPADDVRQHRRRHPVRTAVVLVALAGILGGLLWGGWYYTQQQYYVGVDGEQVVIYRGIPGEVAGLHLSSVYARPGTTVTVRQLKSAAQDRVKQGISAESAADAQEKLRRLLDPTSGNLCDPSASAGPSAPTLEPSGSPSSLAVTASPGTAAPATPGVDASSSVTASPSPTLPAC